jgi:hypothetical protein
MENGQLAQRRNTPMATGWLIRLCVATLGLVTVGAASACSCSRTGVENVVLDKRLSLAKIMVMPPTLPERVASLLNVFKESKTYSVKVVEVIAGQYDAASIKVRSSGPGDCGVDLRYGQTYYQLANPEAAGEPVHASVCNLVDEDYVRQVKAYQRRPKPELAPVPLGSWTQVFKDGKQTVHVDYRSVTSDSHGKYIWILRNFAEDGRIKSEKAHLQIACKERRYNVVSRHEFSGIDASGDAISSVNLSERGHYEWLAIKPDIDGFLPVVCGGQIKR